VVRSKTGACAVILAALFCLLCLVAPVAVADESYGYDLPKELLSPWCPGRTLADCPSPNAENVRMWILMQEAAGRSEEEVKADLLAQFGEEILGAPKAEGVGLAAYVVPALLFVAGGVILYAFLRSQGASSRSAPVETPAPDAPLDPELERLVDEDLAR
jgi:cytochrome c-type biogenesis protein CcmH/NrfF